MTDLELAIELATRAHKGQVDKAGVDYIQHPLAVADQVSGQKEKIVAVLHDVEEDTSIQDATIRTLFGNEIADALDCLNHRKEDDYQSYIERVATNELARKVKLADLNHNMDLSRLPIISKKALTRLEKYKRAAVFLTAQAK